MARKNVDIKIYTSEVLYDVMNKTHLTARSRDIGTNIKEVAYMQVTEDDTEENQVLRSIGDAFALLKSRLSEYVESKGSTKDNTLMDKDINLTLALSLPANANDAALESLPSAIHQYLVNQTVGDWFTITNKNDAADYIARAEVGLQELREAVNKRVRPTR
jgi:hypothetical protein